ncbi:cytochrome c biogenesis heme-transporting ATPase CcmA [Variovorax sp. J22R133]|uniref:cytochrome c biogenesis heme-transporting ATPase CcmA n=1 Tax=Variovorax brevis TaxID=3053503 RepID=UPI002577F9DF|nr:cytochrome c biogenesis heme-transporting ATPase CcmA [Variovorax sp. J22R133]MDM0113784.1 cytochrome c biogenesis heme-transporting ATPase CcmA [Variovorax sp. J22R133]
MVDPALELRDLACVRGGRVLFSALRIAVPRGRLLRVTGANGAGKTSLLRMVCGLLRPAQGDVFWQGTRIGALREEFHRQLAYIGHGAALKDDLSAVENLLVASRLAGANPSPGQALDALEACGLRGFAHAHARKLSQGQRKRVALARLALCSDAMLWVLDEPFDALDAHASDALAQLVARHAGRGGVVLLTSHATALPLPATLMPMELAL